MIRFFLLLLLTTATAGCAAEIPYRVPGRRDPVPYAGSIMPGKIVTIPPGLKPRRVEMRGVWIATTENLDWPRSTSADGFRAVAAQRFGELRKRGFNAVFFQVRPNDDAFYPSRRNAWSKNLTGRAGRGIPAFDPLTALIAEAKRQNLQFHAWLNPYRVVGQTNLRKNQYLATLPPASFARRNPNLVLEIPRKTRDGWTLILNPGEPAVMRHVIETVAEIARNYPVDSIVFDDYFYPYDPVRSLDYRTFERRNPAKLELDDWRRDNVNRLIVGIRRRLNEINALRRTRVEFGISPFGIWANRRNHPNGSPSAGSECYFDHYADVVLWIRRGWIDYVIPQLYWPFTHPVAAYAGLTDWWARQVRGTRVRLYTGQTVQNFRTTGTWNNPNEVLDQLRYNGKHETIQGAVFFSYRGFVTPENPVMKAGTERVTQFYRRFPAAPPRPLPPSFR